jgi:hypothetical protein
MPSRLERDFALWGMERIIELLVLVLDEEEKLQARDGIYEIALEGIEVYEVQVDRMQRRLKPMQN